MRNTNLKTISIKFLDTDDNILKLQDGQPSIVQFHLRQVNGKMPYNAIHLQVDNRSDVLTHPQNMPDNFYVNLKTPIYLNRGAKIALTGISYPNYIQKLPDSIYEEEHEIDGEMDRIYIDLKFSTDLEATQLIDQMNEQRAIYKDTISFDLLRKNSNLYHFQVKYIGEETSLRRLRVLLPDALKRLFGVEGITDIVKDMDENKSFTAENPLINLSSLNQLEAADRRIIVSMSEKYGKFSIDRTSTNNVNTFAISLNRTLEEKLKKYIRFQVSDRHLVITRTCEQGLRLIIIIFQAETKKMLGISLNRNIELPRAGAKFIGDKPIDLYALYPRIMMCYTNFIKYSMLGSDFYPLFRTIPVADKSSRDDEYISVHFVNLEFHKINTSQLDLLHFQFKRINGDFVNFEDSSQKMIVNLTVRNPK